MLSKEYTEALLKSIQSVPLEKIKVYEAGVTSIKLFKPVLKSEANKLNFVLGIGKDSLFSLFDKARIKRQLKEYFNLDVNIIIEEEISDEKKPAMIGESIELNSAELQNFLETQIIPFAEAVKKDLEESNAIDSEEEELQHVTKKPKKIDEIKSNFLLKADKSESEKAMANKILDYLKGSELWEKIQDNPNLLMTSHNILLESKKTLSLQ